MKISLFRFTSLALSASLSVAALYGCGSHDSSVGASRLASDERDGGRGGTGGRGGGSHPDLPCGDASGPGFGEALDCATGDLVASGESYQCGEWVDQCVSNAKQLGLNVECRWNEAPRQFYESTPGACSSAPTTGSGGSSPGGPVDGGQGGSSPGGPVDGGQGGTSPGGPTGGGGTGPSAP
jgi:hypothetical protein